LLESDLAICDAVSMEVLAGARSERHLTQLRGLLARTAMLSTTSADYDAAASMYRSCRARGETVRKLIDCLIGAVAVRTDAEILHADADFSALARHTELRLHPDSLG
jgi:predicted nucleic acid-binding protein